MINQKLKVLLREEFLTSLKVKTNFFKGVMEIFKNPTRDEIDTLYVGQNPDTKSIRMFIDKIGDVYAWRGDILHDEAINTKKFEPEWALDYDKSKNELGHNFSSPKYEGNELSDEILRKSLQRLKGMFPLTTKMIGYYERKHKDYFEPMIKKYFKDSDLEFVAVRDL
jgi:hypothetical protein